MGELKPGPAGFGRTSPTMKRTSISCGADGYDYKIFHDGSEERIEPRKEEK